MRVVSPIATLLAASLLFVDALAQAPVTPPAAEAPAVPVETAAPAAPAGPQLTRSDLEAWLDGFMPFAIERGDIPGAVVVVVKDGQVLLQKGYGYADVKKKQPVDPELTLFRPGSVSKLFTWTAVMQQVEGGKLDLDADVNQYLDFEIPPGPAGKPVRLRDVMTHTPGFEEAVKELIADDPARLVSIEESVKRWIPERIYEAGTMPAYSNYATALAGYMVERVSGQSFDDYIDQHVFAPLGMAHSSFRQPLPEALLAGMSKGYESGSDEPKPYELISMAPAGSLASTASDMARFMIAHLQNGAYGEQRILAEATAKQMHGTPLTIIPGSTGCCSASTRPTPMAAAASPTAATRSGSTATCNFTWTTASATSSRSTAAARTARPDRCARRSSAHSATATCRARATKARLTRPTRKSMPSRSRAPTSFRAARNRACSAC
jgi:CubicO group peptidase (beta-lactamase class C family)